MDTNNPAEMSNQDLEKDMGKSLEGNNLTGQENVSKSTAAEGTLKIPSDDVSSAVTHHTSYKDNEEQDLDDLVHRQAEEISHNGNLPDPDDIPAWEGEETDDQISS